jgi:hypothetical protein
MFLILTLQLLFGVTTFQKELDYKMSDNKHRVKTFLKNISQVESSGGTNFNHELIQKGIHTGDKAIGRYGLMPNTVNEVLNRMRMAGTLTPELQKLKALDHDTLKSTLESNPELEDQIAESLAGRVLDRQQDEDKAAYSWHQGHNLSPEQINEKPYQEHDYVKKYNEYKKLTTGEDDNGQ